MGPLLFSQQNMSFNSAPENLRYQMAPDLTSFIFSAASPDSAGKANRACGCAWHCVTGPANSKHLWSQGLTSPGNSICQSQSVHGSRNAKRSQDLQDLEDLQENNLELHQSPALLGCHSDFKYVWTLVDVFGRHFILTGTPPESFCVRSEP